MTSSMSHFVLMTALSSLSPAITMAWCSAARRISRKFRSVVYYFGEGQYYYDQFYEPFRAYDRPIFAIPGNHDGMVFGSTPNIPQIPICSLLFRRGPILL